jgi:chromosome segregation ATPase
MELFGTLDRKKVWALGLLRAGGGVGTMSDERFGRLEASIKRISKEVILQGERLTSLEEISKKLDKLDRLDDRVTSFAEDIEAARRERKLRDMGFKEYRDTLQDHEARVLRLERERKI